VFHQRDHHPLHLNIREKVGANSKTVRAETVEGKKRGKRRERRTGAAEIRGHGAAGAGMGRT
jgi:hypothetical protein